MAGQLPADDRLRRLRRAGLAVLALSAALATVLVLTLSRTAPVARYVVRPEVSVHGVAAGSVVRFSGVPVGRVARVGFWQDPAGGRVRPELVLALDAAADSSLAELRLRVEEGLRVRFIPVNPASGFLDVDLVWAPGSPLLLATRDPDELPWLPGAQKALVDDAVAAATRMAGEDFRARAGRLAAALASAEASLSVGPSQAAALAARAARLRESVERMDRLAGPDAVATLQGRAGELREALRAAEASLDALDRDLAGMAGPAAEALREFSRSCRAAAERLRRDVPAGDAR